MSKNNQPIGVLDSGVGGLTSVVAIRKILDHENIVYCGDNANAPYGNRSGQEIADLTKKMFTFMQKQNVKAVAVACNTISSTLNSDEYGHYEKDFDFEIIDVISPAVQDVLNKGYDEIGVIATVFTIKTGRHKSLIQAVRPQAKIYGEPSENLAALIEKGDLKSQAIHDDIHKHISNILGAHPDLKEIILGCTHYPIVQDQFEAAAPGVQFINPARDQALAVQKYLADNNLLADESQTGGMQIYTSGQEPVYHIILEELGIPKDFPVHVMQF